MPQPAALKSTHAAIRHYYDALCAYAEQHVEHEGATETAFSRLLASITEPAANLPNWICAGGAGAGNWR